MVDEKLELELINLKKKSAEATQLRARREELIEVFNQLNLEIPSHINACTDGSSKQPVSNELKERLVIVNEKNASLKKNLNLCRKNAEERDMINVVCTKLRSVNEKLKHFAINKHTKKKYLEEYLKYFLDEIHEMEIQKKHLQDKLFSTDCKIDIMICKLTHLTIQLQEPIIELSVKKKNNVPLSNKELLLLKVAEMSVINEKLKLRINDLKNLNITLYDHCKQLQENLLQKLAEDNKMIKKNPYFLQKNDSRVSSRSLSISSSYAEDFFKSNTMMNPLALATLGLNAAEVITIHRNLESLRKSFAKEEKEVPDKILEDNLL